VPSPFPVCLAISLFDKPRAASFAHSNCWLLSARPLRRSGESGPLNWTPPRTLLLERWRCRGERMGYWALIDVKF
jgi:hypothetical protein